MPHAHGHLLVPTSFSRASRQAYGLALEVALGSGARVTLLHVTPRQARREGLDAVALLSEAVWLLPDVPSWARPARPHDALERLRGEVHPEWTASVNVQLACRSGDVVAEIVRFAREEAVDMIVMGARRSSSRLRLRPRLCDRVLQLSSVRVVVVHPLPEPAR